MEIKPRMSKRFGWLLGVGVLVCIGFLVACGSTYNSNSDGLVVVGSQGSGLLETFSFSLTSGHNSAISNPPDDTASEVCVLGGEPASIIIDPAGAYAYSIINAVPSICNNNNPPGIQAFKLNSDGTIAASGSVITLNKANVEVCELVSSSPNPPTNTLVPESVAVVPIALTMDSAGKYLFVANSMTADPLGNAVPGSVSVFAIGSGGTLTEVTNSSDPTQSSPFTVPPSCSYTANFSALAVSPTIFPGIGVEGTSAAPICTIPGRNPPTSEYLYVADKSNNNSVWEFGVNSSTGALSQITVGGQPETVPAGQVPSGIVVDPCNRFVYVTNLQSNNVSAYSVCNGMPTQSQNCALNSMPTGSLVAVSGSPFSLTAGNGPGPIVADPFGNFIYTLDTISNQISTLKIGQEIGNLTVIGSPTATGGSQSISIALRADDNWLFVTNQYSATVSEFAVTPLTGTLSATAPIYTDNLPWGIAVK
jgi:VCBS repeat-containing protein